MYNVALSIPRVHGNIGTEEKLSLHSRQNRKCIDYAMKIMGGAYHDRHHVPMIHKQCAKYLKISARIAKRNILIISLMFKAIQIHFSGRLKEKAWLMAESRLHTKQFVSGAY